MLDPTYEPHELAPEVIKVGDKLHEAIDEITEDNSIFDDISTAIQGKTGQVEPYDKSEMADIISDDLVFPSGILNISSNGDYDVSAKETAHVAVPGPSLITKQITENGTYAAEDDNADGYSEIDVNVPDESKAVLDSLIDLSITTITSDVTSVGNYAFYYCTSLTAANFPEATLIGTSAFRGCSVLTEVNFPKVTSIKEYAFNECKALTEVNFPEVTSIKEYTFQNCSALTEVNFPKVTSIKDYAFQGCTSLTAANFPEATLIGTGAFQNCSALTEVNFPKVTSIKKYAFRNCTGLQYFDMSEVNKVPTITGDTFQSTTCIFLFRDQTQLDAYASATNWAALADRFQIKGAVS